MGNAYHAIVIGGGHNGLVAGAYLARAGARTVVLEGRHKVGGAADTMAPWPEAPEFKVTTLSYVMSLMPDTIQRDLRLADHGYRDYPVGPYFLPFPDGRCIVQYDDDAARNYEEFAKFSKKDADAIERWDAWIGGLADVLGPMLMSIPPTVGSKRPVGPLRAAPPRVAVPRPRRQDDRRRDPADDDEHRRHPRPVLRVGPGEDRDGAERPDRHLGRPARARHRLRDGAPLDRRCRRWPPRRLGRPRGRDGRGERRDRASARDFGAEIRTNARVAKVLTRDGAARGRGPRRTGRSSPRPIVVTAIHPKITFLEQLDRVRASRRTSWTTSSTGRRAAAS